MVKILQHRFVKITLKFFFSHLGLCILVSTYVIAGAFLFRSLETEHEMTLIQMANESAITISNQTAGLKSRIWYFVDGCKKSQNQNVNGTIDDPEELDCTKGSTVLKDWLKQYKDAIIAEFVRTNGTYTGQLHYPIKEKSWTIASSILFTASILTTIGYGHIFPKTQTGQLAVILYSLLAIPLMSIFLVNFGSLFGDFLFIIYQKVCCRQLNKTRAKLHAIPNLIGVEKEKAKAKNDDEHERSTMSSIDEYNPSANTSTMFENGQFKQQNDDDQLSFEISQKDGILESPERVPATLAMGVAALICIFGTMLFSQTEGWDLIPTFYFTFVTLSTMGFGDLVPGWSNGTEQSAWRMSFLAIYAVFGLAVTAMVINISMFTAMDYAQKWSAAIKKYVKVLKEKSLKQI